MTDVAANWQRIRQRATEAAARVGRAAESVRIVAASKAQSVETIEQAIAAGVTDVGESYVQEATEKIGRLTAAIRWHMIGHLQRNKAARAVELFDVIHTLDSVTLGETLARQGERRGRPVRVLIEVNVGAEATKSGVPPGRVQDLLARLAEQRWLLIDGLMAIPPPSPAESARPHFRTLRELRDRLQPDAPANAPLRELSMGMSDDFPVAIEEGATMVRIGRAIFGEREV
jgi:pyridoxal phosphate enzyme (YggS family)